MRPDTVIELKTKAAIKLSTDAAPNLSVMRLFDEAGFEVDDDDALELLGDRSIVYVSFDGAAFIAAPPKEFSGDHVNPDGVNAGGADGNEGARRGALPPHVQGGHGHSDGSTLRVQRVSAFTFEL